MRFEEYYRGADAYWKQNHPTQRVGQAFFNYLAQTQPEVAEKFWSSDVDPFYVDERLPAFLDQVKEELT